MPSDNGTVNTFAYSADQDGQPVLAIVEATAWLKKTDITNLEPLEDAIDTKALRILFSGKQSRKDNREQSTHYSPEFPHISFMYEECIVTVYPDRIKLESE